MDWLNTGADKSSIVGEEVMHNTYCLYVYKQKLANERAKEVWFVNTVCFELLLFEWF